MKIFLFNEKNPPKQVDKVATLPETGFIWIDCTPEELTKTLSLINELTHVAIDDQHIQDCLNPNHPSFFDSMQDYDLLIFRDLMYPPETGKIQTHPVCFLLFEKLLLTVSKDDSAVTKTINRSLDPGRRQPNQPTVLLLFILNAIVDNFLALRSALTEEFTRWQAKLLDEKKDFTQWKPLLEFKTNIDYLVMLCEEQQDALGKWRQNMEEDLPQNISIRLNDLSNHILRVLHHAQSMESELETLMQLHYAIINKRTNEVMRVLTVIFSIFLPLTLITGIYGMNFKIMAGLNSPWGFSLTLLGMGILAILLLVIFKWIRWI